MTPVKGSLELVVPPVWAWARCLSAHAQTLWPLTAPLTPSLLVPPTAPVPRGAGGLVSQSVGAD